jgi:hypothetical protein
MPDGLPYGLNASAIIEQLKEAHDGLKHAPWRGYYDTNTSFFYDEFS